MSPSDKVSVKSLILKRPLRPVGLLFWNITRRQAKSPVAIFHHVLGRGFVFQEVILIFINCLSANQNQLFYMKVEV